MVRLRYVLFPLSWFKVQVFKQGSLYVAYSYKLDIATTGKSEEEAVDVFSSLATVFNEVSDEKEHNVHLMNPHLIKLGWKKQNKRWLPPTKED